MPLMDLTMFNLITFCEENIEVWCKLAGHKLSEIETYSYSREYRIWENNA